jgi:glyoxylate reductase
MARENPALSPDELGRFVSGAAVIVSMFHDRIDAEALAAAGAGLKGVCNFAVGYDNIDLEACRARGVVVCNCPDAVTEGTANMAWGLILSVARRLGPADAFVRSGEFERRGNPAITDWLGAHLTGQNLLIVGAGRIGKAVALRALAFGMRVLYTARTRHVDFELAPLAARRVELDEGLAIADVVSVHTPLTAETRHLLDARRLGLLKPTAIIVNTARGAVIDETALAGVLKACRIWGAGLDVFEHEPRVHPELTGLDNVALAPHVGSAERYWREVMTEIVCENARAIIEGREPPNRIA